MRGLPARARPPVLAVAAAAVALAACESGPSPRERLEAAAEATAAQKSSSFSFEIRAEKSGGSAASGMRMTGEGAYDRESRRGHLKVELPAMGISTRMVSRGDTTYVEVPAAVIGAQNQWLRVVSEDSLSGDTPDLGTAVDSLDVGLLLDAVEGGITATGSRQVQGTQTDGFRFTVSAAKLREGMKQPAEGRAASAEGEQTDGDPDAGTGDEGGALADLEIPVEVWLDADDRIRRLAATVSMGPIVEGARGAMSDTLSAGQRQAAGAMLTSMADSLGLTVEVGDFGGEVEAAVPDDAEIMTLEELRDRLRQSGLGAQRSPPPTGTGG